MQNPQTKECIIRPQKGLIFVDFRELWEFRDILWAFVNKNISARYRQSLLGVTWVVLKPLINMAIFTVLFGKLAKFPSDGIPYPIFVFSGLIPWTYFSSALGGGTSSLVSNSGLISKIYFPRVMLPMSTNISNLLDLGISLLILFVLMLFYKIKLQIMIVFVPLLILALLLTALGPGFFFGALNVKYRDVGQVISFITQAWMYLTPVLYPVSLIPERYRLWAYFNPMTGITDAFRVCMLGHTAINAVGLMISLMMTTVILIGGLIYFKKTERTFADII
jgi:lipopolysaccharide transport system permease protein